MDEHIVVRLLATSTNTNSSPHILPHGQFGKFSNIIKIPVWAPKAWATLAHRCRAKFRANCQGCLLRINVSEANRRMLKYLLLCFDVGQSLLCILVPQPSSTDTCAAECYRPPYEGNFAALAGCPVYSDSHLLEMRQANKFSPSDYS